MESRLLRAIEWTGERCVPWTNEAQGICEHIHRYRFAAALAIGRRALDLGSGEGYGAAMLAGTADSVVGVDVDAAAIEHSRHTYRLPNLTFEEHSVLDLHDFDSGSFSLIVCLEVIEHVQRQDELLAVIRRLLSDDGLLVVSSPDRELYNSTLPEPNPFHVRELDRDAFVGLLSRDFPHLALWGQRSVAGSRLERLEGEGRDDGAHETLVVRRADGWEEAPSANPMFYLAVASRLPLPPTPRLDYLLDPELEVLRERDRRLEEAEARLEIVQQSRAWRAFERYQRARARLFRPRPA